MDACLLVLGLLLLIVQNPLPRVWCHPQWTCLPIPVNILKMIPSKDMLTGQANLDNPSVKLLSRVILDHVRLTTLTCRGLERTAVQVRAQTALTRVPELNSQHSCQAAHNH